MATGGSEKKPTLTESVGLGMRFVISTISASFPSVKNVDTKQLDKWLQNNEREVVLLDCRDPKEYEVSRMSQSVRVEWTTDDVAELINSLPEVEKEGLENKTIVCYCSVGYRSAALAKKIQEYMKKKGSVKKIEVYNLAGSLFKWANEGRLLVDSEGQKTVFAHPYNAVWGKLLNKELRKG
ncbi:uncharacterized protein LOC121367633 [Gigantopelta aegis]|uniref:uncharacterized protein LOC121367633 n=1 Tax=Gigantopelta aegis TaxID=1735272 RepID=UPI001B88D598|nr:uncharacterized protein LOC121367633 [Gigantopelta aegis]